MKQSYLPISQWIRTYNWSFFRADLIAGITVAVMLVPQGMAYASLAGMPEIYGLYAGIIPLFLYAIFGTSRHLSIGPVALSAILVVAGISQLETPKTEDYIILTILTGFLVGVVQLAMGLFRMGFLVNFLSRPVISGFSSAAAIIIALSQLKDVLGFDIPRMEYNHQSLIYVIEHIAETNWVSVVMCGGSILVLLLFKKIHKAIPGALLVVVAGILLTWGLNLKSLGLDVLEEIPNGLPAFAMPDLTWEKIKILVPTVITVSIMGVVECISIAKVLESKHQDYVINPNQELLAIGMSKIGGSFFQDLPTSGSFSRSAVNSESGAKTGMASIFTALIIGLVLIYLTSYLYYLPKAVLAAIILLAIRSLFDFKEGVYLWKNHKRDFTMLILTFLVTLILGIAEGVFVGVMLSIFAVLYKSSNPHVAVLGRLPGTTKFRNMDRFEKASQPVDVLIVRFDDQLYFANAAFFKDKIKSLVREKGDELQTVILDASSIHDIDSSGLHALNELLKFLNDRKISLLISRAIGPVRDLLFKSGLMEKIGNENHFLDIHDAVLFFENKQGWSEDALQTNIDNEE